MYNTLHSILVSSAYYNSNLTVNDLECGMLTHELYNFSSISYLTKIDDQNISFSTYSTPVRETFSSFLYSSNINQLITVPTLLKTSVFLRFIYKLWEIIHEYEKIENWIQQGELLIKNTERGKVYNEWYSGD